MRASANGLGLLLLLALVTELVASGETSIENNWRNVATMMGKARALDAVTRKLVDILRLRGDATPATLHLNPNSKKIKCMRY